MESDKKERERDRDEKKDREKDRSDRKDRDRDRDRDRDDRDKTRSRRERDDDDEDRRRKSKRRSRSRSRSRSRDRRSRRKSRSRSRSRSPRDEEAERKRQENREKMRALLANLNQQAQNPQATDIQRRKIYVGNLPVGVGLKDVNLADFFNQALQTAGLASGLAPPVLSVWMSSEGKFAFVEFRSPKDAENALMLDGAIFHGRPLRIQRPADLPNPKFGGGMMSASVFPNMAVNAQLAALGGGGFGMAPGGGTAFPIPIASAPGGVPGGVYTLKATRILVLSNMVALEDLKDDEGYEEIRDDVKDECEKFGTVENVFIPRPDPENASVKGLGRIFVTFANADEATAASKSLAGRKFAGRVVLATFIEESDFEKRTYD
eukprot:tig00000383_g24647.t1